jgi:hypothetical protein
MDSETTDKQKRFGIIVGALLEAHSQEATAPRLLGYWLALKDLDLRLIEQAVVTALQTIKGRPADPAQLREIATGGSVEVLAVSAWADVVRSRNISYMTDLDFEDRIINAVIRNLNGRENFYKRLNGTADDAKWLRIEFVRIYQTYAQSPPSEELMAVLEGAATHGVVSGRSHTPRIETIKADQTRLLAVNQRVQARIANRSPLPRVEWQKINLRSNV